MDPLNCNNRGTKDDVLQTDSGLYRPSHIFRMVSSTNAVGWSDWKEAHSEFVFGN